MSPEVRPEVTELQGWGGLVIWGLLPVGSFGVLGLAWWPPGTLT
jgi:hypothetical protein